MAPNPSQFPLGPPTTRGTEITVDQWLRSSRLIERSLADMIVQSEDFFVGEAFAGLGRVEGGALLFNMVLANSLYSDRRVQRIQPGGEYPILTSDIGEPKVAKVDKYGGRIFITDEAKNRNRSDVFAREQAKLGFTLQAQLNAVAMTVLDAAIADTDRATGGRRTLRGTSWLEAAQTRKLDVTPIGSPAADFGTVLKQFRDERQGLRPDLLITSTQEAYYLDLLFGDKPGGVQGFLDRFGIRRHFVSSYQEDGAAKILASKKVGVIGSEEPFNVRVRRDEDHDQTWVIARAMPIVAVDNRWAVVELTDLDART